MFDAAPACAPAERAAAVEQLHRATALYTRSHVVDALLSQAGWPAPGRLLCDPAAGDGAFLGAALQRLLEVTSGATPADIVGALEGWEIHAGAAAAARARLAEQLRQHGVTAAEETAAAVVRCGDFLTDGPTQARFDVIAGNPPYLRASNVPGMLQEAYRLVVPDHARADLLHAFLDRCAGLLKPGGVVAMVTSDRWLFNSTAARLREVLGAQLRIGHLARIDGATAFYRPKERRAGTPPRVHPVTVCLERASGDGVHRLDGAPIYPGVGADGGQGPVLADVAKVRISPWLGTRGVFHVDAETAAKLPQDWVVPVADGRDFRDGIFRGPRSFAIRTEGADELPGPIMDHVRRTIGRMCARGRRAPFWLPPESWWGRFDLSAESLIVPRIARDLTPIRIPAGVLAINHAVTVAQAGSMSLQQIEQVLRAAPAQRWVRDRAPRLENGYFSICTTLLRQVPISQASDSAAVQPRSAGPSAGTAG